MSYATSSNISLADSRALWKPAVTIGLKAWCNSSVGCKIEKPSWSAVNYKQTCAHSCSCCDLMAEATPATAVPNARLSGTKRKKVPGSSSHSWDSYLHKVLQDNHPGVKITKEAMQVWAEALDAWLQQLAQEIVQEHTSQALTPQNVQASLQLLLAKGDTSKENSALTESVAKHPNTGS